MSDINITELRKIAENATPGPWQWEPPSGEDWPVEDESLVTTWSADDGYPKSVVTGWGYDASGTEAGPQDRAFIATFNPEMVLALLDRVEKAEQTIARVRGLHRKDEVNNGWYYAWCVSCSSDEYPEDWPCPTIAALGEERV